MFPCNRRSPSRTNKEARRHETQHRACNIGIKTFYCLFAGAGGNCESGLPRPPSPGPPRGGNLQVRLTILSRCPTNSNATSSPHLSASFQSIFMSLLFRLRKVGAYLRHCFKTSLRSRNAPVNLFNVNSSKPFWCAFCLFKSLCFVCSLDISLCLIPSHEHMSANFFYYTVSVPTSFLLRHSYRWPEPIKGRK